MVATQPSGTARRFIGVLVLIPIIAAVWSDVKIASIVILILAIGMAHEFSKMLKMPFNMTIVLTLLIGLQSFPVWMFNAGVVWHSVLAMLSFGIIIIYTSKNN